VSGDHELPTLPFRFSRVDHWLHAPSPTLGQHNDEVLSDIGLTPAEIASLREAGIVGDRIAGGR
jgi:crotonobetainyl-CoA:carnitine CoA-transferase CaiB-like acyl-CoA transferase